MLLLVIFQRSNRIPFCFSCIVKRKVKRLSVELLFLGRVQCVLGVMHAVSRGYSSNS
jgi:hypothetical protein